MISCSQVIRYRFVVQTIWQVLLWQSDLGKELLPLCLNLIAEVCVTLVYFKQIAL